MKTHLFRQRKMYDLVKLLKATPQAAVGVFFLALPGSDRLGRFGKDSQRFVGRESAFFSGAETFPAKNVSPLSFRVKSSRICVLFPLAAGGLPTARSPRKDAPGVRAAGGMGKAAGIWGAGG